MTIDRSTPTHPARVKTTTETMWEAARLRSAGLTFRDIGQQLGKDPTWVRTLVLRALKESTYEAADMMRTQEGLRLDLLQRANMRDAIDPNIDPNTRIKAATIIIRVMERRARLFGLDAPVQAQVEVTATTGEIDSEIKKLTRLLTETPTSSDAVSE